MSMHNYELMVMLYIPLPLGCMVRLTTVMHGVFFFGFLHPLSASKNGDDGNDSSSTIFVCRRSSFRMYPNTARNVSSEEEDLYSKKLVLAGVKGISSPRSEKKVPGIWSYYYKLLAYASFPFFILTRITSRQSVSPN